MNDKKNIDRLFQERFKDFEYTPNDKIWNNIHDALHEKKKRRVIPIWWKLSGIAAGLFLAFLAFNPFENKYSDNPTVVITPKEIDTINNSKINATNNSEITIAVENSASSVNENSSKSRNANETRIAAENTNSSLNENEENSNQNSTLKTTINRFSTKKRGQKIVHSTLFGEKSNKKNQDIVTTNTSALKEELVSNSTVEKSNENNQLNTRTTILNTDSSVVLTEMNSNKNKIVKDTDSTALALASETNPLEEILKKKNEKEEGVLATAKLSRWQVTTNVAPVYFNSVSNGSPIESQFAENNKSYENNLSLGVGVQYAVNKKLSVRTGINKVTLGYATNDVVFFGALNSISVSTLSTDNSTSNIEVVSSTNVSALRPFEDNMANVERGVLNQTMGYYEVPLELSYAILNRKFGIDLIGGFSTLFLNENSVSVQSATTTMDLGKANNLNDIHLSSNIGVGFKYEFWKSFEAHFEPTFKYQFNTFSRDAGNFKPYFVGLYTGISFKF